MIHGNNILKVARKYTSWRWRVVPIPPREKAPRLMKWQYLHLGKLDLPEYFRKGNNIGVLLGKASDGLIDVDLDCDEAILLAPMFLPETSKVHGRKSKPESHYWYRVETSPKPEKFCDIDGTTLLELRSTGQQTVVPPSIHPSGERVHWEKKGKSGRVKVAKLQTAVKRLAAAVLLSRHWPATGSRNEAAMALAGVLLRDGWDESSAAEFISKVAFAANDEEWKERGDVAATTQRRLDRAGDATGIPRLSRLIDKKAIDLFLEWLKIKVIPNSRPQGGQQPNKWPKPLKEEAFHGLTGEVIRTIVPTTEADPAALLVQFLVAFGSVIGPGAHFKIEAAKHRANLFCLVVGRSSKARKGTAWAHIGNCLSRLIASGWRSKSFQI